MSATAKPTAALVEHAGGGPPFKGAFQTRRPRRRSAPMVTAYDGRNLLGHIFNRGADGYEAVDRDGTVLGHFSDQRAALDAFDHLVVGEDDPRFEQDAVS